MGKIDGYSSLFKLKSNPSYSKILVLSSYAFQGKTDNNVVDSLNWSFCHSILLYKRNMIIVWYKGVLRLCLHFLISVTEAIHLVLFESFFSIYNPCGTHLFFCCFSPSRFPFLHWHAILIFAVMIGPNLSLPFCTLLCQEDALLTINYFFTSMFFCKINLILKYQKTHSILMLSLQTT